jgi:hypothetical protein
MNAFKYWLTREAEWYEFYFPKSGLIGGLIFGAIVVIIGFTIHYSL